MATQSTSEKAPLIVKFNDANDGNEASPLTASSLGSTATGSCRGIEGDKDSTINNNATNGRKRRFAYDSIHLSLQKSASNLSEALMSMKRIGYLGSWSIAVNSLTGPAMLCLPDTYQRAGLIPTTVVILFVCILSALCCLHMSNTISKVPGNRNFTKDIGYSECFNRFWGPKSYHWTQFLFFCCVTCLNVSSIVDIAQVVDTFLGHWFDGGSGALHFHWMDATNSVQVDWVRWDYESCTKEMLINGDCIPFFDQDGILLTTGYGIILLIFMPMALMDLKENAAVQCLGFVVLLVTAIGFIILFVKQGVDLDNVSLWGTEWGSLFGVVLFNFALVIAVPAWLYEKEPEVDVPAVVHGSSILSAALYILIGILGSVTMPFVSQNMLESLMSGAFGLPMQMCASIFAFFIVGLGCPLFSVLNRMNFVGSGLMSRNAANWLSVYLPFFSSWIFYQGDAVTALLSWGGIIFTSLIAFILPLLLTLHAMDATTNEGAVDVYEPLHITSKRAQKRSLYILLVVSVLSIFFAIFGNVFNDDIMELAAVLNEKD